MSWNLLQIFADDYTGASVGISENGSMAPDDNGAGQNATDRNAEFLELVNGDYKEEAQGWLKDKLGKRMKGKDAKIHEYDEYRAKMTPAMEKLAVRYGVTDPQDIDAIMAAMAEDDSYFENYAIEHGVTTEQAKTLIKAERINKQNEQRKLEEQEKQAFNEKYSGWLQEAEQLKQLYPKFDFDYESNNEDTGERFSRFVASGVSVQDAYELVHKEDIMSGAMAYAINKMQQDAAANRQSRVNRPAENGTSAQQPSKFNDSMDSLSSEEVQKIANAVKSGYKVTPNNFRSYL